jgi:carboxymethylenebutenolidase
MCDETDFSSGMPLGVTRRSFAAGGALAGLAACASMDAGPDGAGLTEAMVSVPSPDGPIDAFFVHPAKRAPAVILWPDIAGVREAKKAMARRLAGDGYAVIVPNPYFRDVPAHQFADFADFVAQKGFQKVAPWRAKVSTETIGRDARALVAWLDSQRAIDTRKGIGNQGYCMTGGYTIHSAAAVPNRIKASASFHGGGLASDKPDSPHRMLKPGAGYLIAIARDDDAKQPAAKTMLREAADASGASAEIEVYPAGHGWCVPDAPAYDAVQADRAWGRLLALYRRKL